MGLGEGHVHTEEKVLEHVLELVLEAVGGHLELGHVREEQIGRVHIYYDRSHTQRVGADLSPRDGEIRLPPAIANEEGGIEGAVVGHGRAQAALQEDAEIGVEISVLPKILAPDRPGDEVVASQNLPRRDLETGAHLIETEGVPHESWTRLKDGDDIDDPPAAIPGDTVFLREPGACVSGLVIPHHRGIPSHRPLVLVQLELVQTEIVGVVTRVSHAAVFRDRR